MKIKQFISILFWLCTFATLGVSLYYNITLQEQVNERDVLIKKLTHQDSILHSIMDFEVDSVTGSSSYTYIVRNGDVLKYNELAEELNKSKEDNYSIIDRHNQNIKERIESIEDYNQLVKNYISLSEDYKNSFEERNILVQKHNKNIAYNNKILKELHLVKDSLSSFKAIVEFTQSSYGVEYGIKKEGEKRIISISSSRIDSALIIYPYFKNRLTKDTIKNVWLIETTNRIK